MTSSRLFGLYLGLVTTKLYDLAERLTISSWLSIWANGLLEMQLGWAPKFLQTFVSNTHPLWAFLQSSCLSLLLYVYFSTFQPLPKSTVSRSNIPQLDDTVKLLLLLLFFVFRFFVYTFHHPGLPPTGLPGPLLSPRTTTISTTDGLAGQ